MTPYALTFLALAAFALVILPTRWALLPLLLGACYMTAAQQVAIGPFHFTVLRTLIASFAPTGSAVDFENHRMVRAG